MTPAEFKAKWAKFSGKESGAYQSHFDDLCRLLRVQPPLEADPAGQIFCFQKHVAKDAEQLSIERPTAGKPTERGFADVWKKGCFAWEYKGKNKDLDAAYRQLLRYREGLLNPPLLVVCDFDRYIIKTNFNGTIQEKYEFTNNEIDRPDNLRVLRALFEDPNDLRPAQTTAEVTEELAEKIANIALSLHKRESAEIADSATRKRVSFAQKKNLRIARFLNRIVFCFFAEDSGLLPHDLFTDIVKTALDDAKQFSAACEELFRVMAKGGMFGRHKIRHFNGHLFEEATVFELNEVELGILVEAADAKWQFIQPSIMGTLFERALDETQRAQLGAHYTSEADIRTIVEPVLMAPLRAEYDALKVELAPALKKGKGGKKYRTILAAFLKKLSSTVVFDPACGSGNFLYVSLQLLLDLEKDVITLATQLGIDFKPQVSVRQLRAIELNPYAYELAQVSVQIGYLQWRRDNGFDNDRTPVLQVLDGFENIDALMTETFKKKTRTLKAARKQEHDGQESLFKLYVEREWPACDVIIGNPPWLGDKKMRRRLGDRYVEDLRRLYSGRVSGQSDLFCYWFEKARDLIEKAKCKRAGLLASQSIRGPANRRILERIKETGDIFFAVSDRDWLLAGATVHASLIGFDDGSQKNRLLDGIEVTEIAPDLKAETASASNAAELHENAGLAFIGTMKKGKFEIPESKAIELLSQPNPTGKNNSDVLRPWIVGKDITGRPLRRWLIDFPFGSTEADAAGYEAPFEIVRKSAYQKRVGHREGVQSKYWWRLARSCPELRKAITGLSRSLVTPAVSKQRFFVWSDSAAVPDQQVITFATESDYFAGILESRYHRIWIRRKGNQLREAESASRYNVRECFLTFPFPRATAEQESDIATAAKNLNELRERWLNPPEWTQERALEFPGSHSGPWQRYIDVRSVNTTGTGIVHYPRPESRNAECAAKLKNRTLTRLYNERPAWLELAHKRLDATVAAAYGIPATMTEQKILDHLLALNLARAAKEAESTP